MRSAINRVLPDTASVLTRRGDESHASAQAIDVQPTWTARHRESWRPRTDANAQEVTVVLNKHVHHVRTLAVVAALAICGTFGLSGTAWANSEAKTDAGAKAKFASVGAIFTLDDTDCDGDPVYISYRVNNGSLRRLNFSGGCHATSAKYDLTLSAGTRVSYRACVKDEGSDPCSGVTDDVVTRSAW